MIDDRDRPVGGDRWGTWDDPATTAVRPKVWCLVRHGTDGKQEIHDAFTSGVDAHAAWERLGPDQRLNSWWTIREHYIGEAVT